MDFKRPGAFQRSRGLSKRLTGGGEVIDENHAAAPEFGCLPRVERESLTATETFVLIECRLAIPVLSE